MPVTINGDGTITGYTPPIADGSITAAKLAPGAAVPADGSITAAKLASGAITTSALPAGTVVQMVSCSPVLSGYWSSMSDWTDLTGMSVTITPKASTNKLLLRAQVHQGDAGNDFTACIGFKKNGTLLSYSVNNNWGYGDFHEYSDEDTNNLAAVNTVCEREEVAGATTALTFQVCIRSGGPGWSSNNVYVGRTNRSENYWYNSIYVRSTFRILEIAA